MFRFMLDVALIFSYGVVLLVFRHLTAVLFLLTIIYAVFVVWDVLKILEYREVYLKPAVIRGMNLTIKKPVASAVAIVRGFSRQFASLWFAACFAVLWFVASSEHSPSEYWLAASALLFTLLYRVGKSHLFFSFATTLALNIVLFVWFLANMLAHTGAQMT